jgi:hypothetical protein
VALAIVGDWGGAAKAWAEHQKRAQEAMQAQTGYLVNLQTMTDASKKASDATLNLGNAHQKAARHAHEHAAAARDVDKVYRDILPHILTVGEALNQMWKSDYEDKIRAQAKGIHDAALGIMPKALTAAGAPSGMDFGGLLGGSLLATPGPPVMTKMEQLRAQFHQFFTDLQQQGAGFGDKVFGSLEEAIDGVSSQLAQLVVTGRANFRELFTGLTEQIVKSGIQSGFGHLAGKAAGAFGMKGPGTARGDSPGNPLYTKDVSAGGGMLPGAPKGGGAGGESGPASAFRGITSKLSDTFHSIFSHISGIVGKLAGSMGSLLGGIGHLFGGFLAGGGNVTPGKAYVVGERHPEFFVPRQAGQVAPALHMAGQPQQTIVQFHVHGVSDFDSFKRSQGQIGAMLLNQMAIAHSRNK